MKNNIKTSQDYSNLSIANKRDDFGSYGFEIPLKFRKYLPEQYNKHHINVLCLVLLLDQIHIIHPQNKDRIQDDYSTNYGIVRPILRELYLESENALPVLIHFIDNKNYLYSRVYYGSKSPMDDPVTPTTLGDSLRQLFIDIVDVTPRNNIKGRKGSNGEIYPRPFFTSGMSLTQWWDENNGKNLLQLQQEIIDYYIKEEKRIGFPDSESEQQYLFPLLEMRQKLPFINTEYKKYFFCFYEE